MAKLKSILIHAVEISSLSLTAAVREPPQWLLPDDWRVVDEEADQGIQ